MSSQEFSSYLLTEMKSLPKKIPSTPFTERIFLTSSLFNLSYLVTSNDLKKILQENGVVFKPISFDRLSSDSNNSCVNTLILFSASPFSKLQIKLQS